MTQFDPMTDSQIEPELLAELEAAEAELNPPFKTINKFFRDGWDMIEIRKGDHDFYRWIVVINEGLICEGQNTNLSTCERDSQIAYDTFLPIYRDSDRSHKGV